MYDVALQLYSDPTNVFAVIDYSLDDDVEFKQVVPIVNYTGLNVASKLVIDLSGRIISTKKYEITIPPDIDGCYILREDGGYLLREDGTRIRREFCTDTLSYILREDGFYILREDGFRFIRE